MEEALAFERGKRRDLKVTRVIEVALNIDPDDSAAARFGVCRKKPQSGEMFIDNGGIQSLSHPT